MDVFGVRNTYQIAPFVCSSFVHLACWVNMSTATLRLLGKHVLLPPTYHTIKK